MWETEREREGEMEGGRGQAGRHQKAKSIDTNRADSSGRSNPQVKSFCHFQILRLAEANPWLDCKWLKEQGRVPGGKGVRKPEGSPCRSQVKTQIDNLMPSEFKVRTINPRQHAAARDPPLPPHSLPLPCAGRKKALWQLCRCRCRCRCECGIDIDIQI